MVVCSPRITRKEEKDNNKYIKKGVIVSSPAGLEPTTFRLSAERSSQLRHGDKTRTGDNLQTLGFS